MVDAARAARRAAGSLVRNENGLLAGYVYVDLDGRDINGYVADARRLLDDNLTLPSGYTLVWSGQYVDTPRARERLMFIVPVTLLLVVGLLYANTGSM